MPLSGETWCAGCGKRIDWQAECGQVSVQVNITRSPHRDEDYVYMHGVACVALWAATRLVKDFNAEEGR